MKKIAIDLDDVVFDSETLYRVYSEFYDTDILKSDNLIDNSERTFQKRYNWNDEICNTFYEIYTLHILKSCNLMPGVDFILNKLKRDYDLVIITARSDEELEITKERLKEVGLEYVKIHHNQTTKIETFIKEKVDIIIDDDLEICRSAAKQGFLSLYFKSSFAPIVEEPNLKTVTTWGEIYNYLVLNDFNTI